MAWSTEVREGGYGMRQETVTLASGAATDVSTSVIDFIPAGRSWQVYCNTEAVDITGAIEADLELDASFDKATFTVMVANLIATISAVANPVSIVPERTAGHGYAPYFKLRIDPSGNTAAEEINIRIVYPLEKPSHKPRASEKGFRINP
jgi:hypothetical protein